MWEEAIDFTGRLYVAKFATRLRHVLMHDSIDFLLKDCLFWNCFILCKRCNLMLLHVFSFRTLLYQFIVFIVMASAEFFKHPLEIRPDNPKWNTKVSVVFCFHPHSAQFLSSINCLSQPWRYFSFDLWHDWNKPFLARNCKNLQKSVLQGKFCQF